MTISSTTNRVNYTGNGATASYDFTFKVFNKADLKVTKRDTDNVETLLTVDVDYTVSGVGERAGGSITLTAGNLPSGYKLTIRRIRSLKQETDFRNQGDFYPETHEDALDGLVMQNQAQQDELDRALKLPETATGVSPVLPMPVAKKWVRWNAGATALENTDAADLGSASVIGAGLQLAGSELSVIDSVLYRDNGVDLREFLPEGFVSDGSADYTDEVQAANDTIDSTGGTLLFPSGTWRFNLTASNGVSIKGTGIKSTIFRPAADDAVIKTKLTDNTANVVYEDFQIYGNTTLTTQQDGIRLKATTAGKFIMNVHIRDVQIRENGRYGLTTYGDATTGPFVQQLTLRNIKIYDCVQSGLYVDGYLFETVFENVFIYRNGDATYPNIRAVINGASGAINRLTWIGGAVNHSNYPTTGIAARFAHAKGLTFIGVDFEEADKMLYIEGNQSRQLTLLGSNFQSNNDVTEAAYIEDLDGLSV